MKNPFLLFIISLMIFFAGCDKEERLESNLQGTWELRHVFGGQIAGVSPDYLPGNGNIIKFDGAKYERWYDGKMVSSGTFMIIESKTEIDGTKYSYKLDFDDKMMLDVHFKISDKKLMMSNGSQSHDGTTLTYQKI